MNVWFYQPSRLEEINVLSDPILVEIGAFLTGFRRERLQLPQEIDENRSSIRSSPDGWWFAEVMSQISSRRVFMLNIR